MVSQKYRWDFIGLSTDEKPTSETSDKVVNGSTYYCSDTSKLYVYCDGTWYERKPLGGGGASDFNDLSNRPKYNGSDMTGSTNIPEVKSYTAGSNVTISDQNVISAIDTTYSAFTGTDGTAAGAAGLVPAPAITDAGKFLKADGTWDTAGGGSSYTAGDGIDITNAVISATNTGKAKVLTSADYNWRPTGSGASTHVALWKLDAGVYTWNNVYVAYNTTEYNTTPSEGTAVVGPKATSGGVMVNIMKAGSGDISVYRTRYNGAKYASDKTVKVSSVTDTLTSTSVTDPLSANQGKVLKDLVDSLAIRAAGAPTTSTVGVLGQLYTDTTNMHTYQCTAISGDTYTWTQRW